VLLHFAVRDTGIGIEKHQQDRIFDPFSQGDTSTARKYGGTGLGLTISRRLVSMMGGRIWLESEPGRGSTFHFSLSLGVQPTPAVREPVQPEDLAGLHALIVDDNSTNRRVLHGMLVHWGVKPFDVDGAREAWRAIAAAVKAGNPFRLILLDSHMPEMDGFALAREIREDEHLRHATIMMLTSAGHLGDAARCRELGIAAYLVKPIGKSELLAAICQVLRAPRAEEKPALVTRHTVREEKERVRILLAEDNNVNQTLATRILEKRGYIVTVAPDGKAALGKLAEAEFDLVLMDIQMPEMDGFEATAAIRQREKQTARHIPIIAMTAHALKGDHEKCLIAGMDGYVSKPIRTSELFQAIEKLLGRASKLETSDLPAFYGGPLTSRSLEIRVGHVLCSRCHPRWDAHPRNKVARLVVQHPALPHNRHC
jgi:two-component system, sensor histidine kinase and response regulator